MGDSKIVGRITNVLKHPKFGKSEAPPNKLLHERIRQKIRRMQNDRAIEIREPRFGATILKRNDETQSRRQIEQAPKAMTTSGFTRRQLITDLKKQANDDKSRKHMHANATNSNAMNGKAKLKDPGEQKDHKPMGAYNRRMSNPNALCEHEAIGRLLALRKC